MVRRWIGIGLRLGLGVVVALVMSAAIPVPQSDSESAPVWNAPQMRANACGRVCDSAGNGVAGITVIAFHSSTPGTRDVVAMATTDVSGSYRIEGVSDGVYGFWIRPNDVTGWIPTTVGDNVVICGVETSHVDFEYDPVSWGRVTGIAENELGHIGGARISLDDARMTRASADGRFCFAGVAPGTHTLVASADGCVAQKVEFEVGAGDIAVVDVSPSPTQAWGEEVARQ